MPTIEQQRAAAKEEPIVQPTHLLLGALPLKSVSA